MSETHPIRDKIIAGVASGIILAILSSIWPPARRFLGWVWASLSMGVTVPVWGMILVAAVMVAVLFLAARGRRRSLTSDQAGTTIARSPKTSATSPADEDSGKTVELSGLEREMLRRIAKQDGEAVYQDTLKRSLSTTNLRLEAARDRLIELDLVEVFQEGEEEEDEIAIILTTKGRQYVIDRRLA